MSKKQSKIIDIRRQLEEYYSSLYSAHSALLDLYDLRKEEGTITDDIIANRLGLTKQRVKKMLYGHCMIDWKMLTDLSAAMDGRMEITFVPHEQLKPFKMPEKK